ncbi:MAG: F0F1 ATP synthase subunit gamma [Alphaproteobacteria bacterium]
MTTLQSIRKVVRTMKTLSAVNTVPYERAAASIDAFHETVLRGLQIVLRQSDLPWQIPVTDKMPRIALVFGSDHGLCGGYNETVAQTVAAGFAGLDSTIFTIGARMTDALDALHIQVERCFTPPASVEGVGRLTGDVLIALDEARARATGGEVSVSTVHMRRDGQGVQAPVLNNLLPVKPEFLADLKARPWRSHSLPTFLMPPSALFGALIRNHLFASVYRATAEAMMAENAARLALMQQAERSIDDRLSELLVAIRSVRQSEITNELLDVIAGFEALDH